MLSPPATVHDASTPKGHPAGYDPRTPRRLLLLATPLLATSAACAPTLQVTNELPYAVTVRAERSAQMSLNRMSLLSVTSSHLPPVQETGDGGPVVVLPGGTAAVPGLAGGTLTEQTYTVTFAPANDIAMQRDAILWTSMSVSMPVRPERLVILPHPQKPGDPVLYLFEYNGASLGRLDGTLRRSQTLSSGAATPSGTPKPE